ncbi:hypothetical protein BC938DRAFT_477412 [Jimgerdemannia flammicorona]|uniref:Large ribosomal subunit protein bL21m n=1 Tax=Jimgerdemannia flammicorona TaxID=994334 RepID=A0A433QYW1_9FUNG|nr:hypothetical protein BC938DRAFT_477412 [Jimgerdemannia flammicorona]
MRTTLSSPFENWMSERKISALFENRNNDVMSFVGCLAAEEPEGNEDGAVVVDYVDGNDNDARDYAGACDVRSDPMCVFVFKAVLGFISIPSEEDECHVQILFLAVVCDVIPDPKFVSGLVAFLHETTMFARALSPAFGALPKVLPASVFGRIGGSLSEGASVAPFMQSQLSRYLVPAVAAVSHIHTTRRVTPSPQAQPASSTTALATLDATTKDAVSLLRSQLRYYAIVEIMGRPHLITKNDLVIVNRLLDVEVGDVVELNRVRELGSRDYTIKGSPYVSEKFYTIRATVVEHTKSRMIRVVKKKRRKNYKRTVTHKQTHTSLRIAELDINKLD